MQAVAALPRTAGPGPQQRAPRSLQSGGVSTTVSDPMVGRLLDRRYRIETRLAVGGMATVYAAHDTRLDRKVAVKIMHGKLATDETFVNRFIREAHSAASLSHPNVVAVYDQGEDDGIVFLAMELVTGRTLRDVLKERGQLQPREALEVLKRILSALAAAHAAGLVHRDVKPENVLISDEGRVKVADFGLARAISTGGPHTTGIIIGTVAYLAPEQVENGRADARSDVYSAGVVLYEMLAGKIPFTADTPLAVAYKHVHEDVPAPSAAADVPLELDELVARATHRDPEQRPADAAELLADVTACRRTLPDDVVPPFDAPLTPAPEEGQTLVMGKPAPAPTDGPAPLSDTERKKRRRKGVLAFALVLLLAVATGVGGWWYGMGRWTEAPKLAGMSSSEAIADAKEAGFEVETKRVHHERVDKGKVAMTNPGSGDRILRGGTITLVISRGPERHAVPKLKGLSETRARAAITAAKLSVGEVTRRYSAKVDKGAVISVSPKAGELLRRDARVDLVISKGIPPVSVPQVTGLGESTAEQKLDDAGLKVRTTYQAHKTAKKGTVFAQSPQAATKKPKGSTVTISVSTGPPIVQVPDVTDMPIEEATRKLQAAGFQVETNRVPGGGGKVIQQEPKKQARYGSIIKLWVF
ncbi:MAG: Stk1 family PASTA domain-containing Ser/Thr kinase [Streptosporangiales bacterium]|nr:Stk1 family PASTA domain-containing Ser/Thr kinase [Streptosporangiales bacterium]